MRKAHAFLSLLTEGGNAGCWSYSPATQQIYADAGTCQLMQCASQPVSRLSDLLARVHATERAALHKAIQRAIDLQGSFAMDFRVQGQETGLSMRARWSALPDGSCGELNGVVQRSSSLHSQVQENKQRLERANTVLLDMVDQAPLAVGLLRVADGVFVKVNALLEELFGYSREELIGATATQLRIWEPAHGRDRMLDALRADGHARNLVAGFRHKSGRKGRMLMAVQCLEVDGEPMMLGMLTDITEREEAKQSLASSEARYKMLSEASFEGVGLARNGIVVDANEQIARILGVARADLIGKPVTHTMRPADVPKALHALKTGGDSFNEYEYLRPDGTRVALEVSSKDLVQGNEVLRISALRDITERKQKEVALRQLQLRFTRMMEANVVGLFIAGGEGEIFEANDYFLNMLGRSRAELDAGALNWRSLTSPDSVEKTLHNVRSMQHSGGSLPYEKEYLHADGHLVPAIVALSQLAEDSSRAIVIVVDISDLKASQNALLKTNAQLEVRTREAEHAEAAKTLFLSSISHELRTPLHTVLGYVRLLRKAASGEELQQLTVVEHSSTQLLRLIEDLLEFNHAAIAPERLLHESVVLDGFLANLESIGNAAAAGTGNVFFSQLEGDLPTAIVVDEGRLVQVLRILIDNACKYTRAGAVILSISSEGLRREVPGRACLRFAVEDNGRGMDAEDTERIFEPLNRGRNASDRPGLGLGLAIASQWVTRMGSKIEVDTTRGLGSCFSFVLELEASYEAEPALRELVRSMQFSLQTPERVVAFEPLPQSDLDTLGRLIDMGRVGRLREWARDVELRYPEHLDAARYVDELARNAELDALEKLHRRWLALGAVRQAGPA